MPCYPDRLTREPAPLGARLLAAVPGFIVACLVAPIPTAAFFSFPGTEFSMGGWGLGAMRGLMILPIFWGFTAVFSGPFALPVLFAMAWRDARGLVPHVGLGIAATLPAMAWFQAAMSGGLPAPIVGTILAGGALGGFAASAARDAVESWSPPRESRWLSIARAPR